MGFMDDIVSGVGSIFNPDPTQNTSTTVPYAGMSPEERNLYDVLTKMLGTQSDMLNTQVADYNAQKPGLTNMVNSLDSTTGADINAAFAGRTLAALKGELPDDPALLRQLNIGDQAVNSQLRSNLGPGYATSTPGSTALNDWEERKQELLYSARHNDMNEAFQNYLSGTNNLFSRGLQKAGALSSISTGGLPFVAAGNQLTGAVSSPLQTLMQQQLGTSGIAQKYFNDKLDYRGSLIKSAGSFLGGLFGGG